MGAALNDIDDVKAKLEAALRENQANSVVAAGSPRGDTIDPRGNRPARPTCSSGKVCFPDEAAARRRLKEILDSAAGGSLYVPTKVRGPCRRCGYFHLTSKAGKPWKRGKSRRNDVR